MVTALMEALLGHGHGHRVARRAAALGIGVGTPGAAAAAGGMSDGSDTAGADPVAGALAERIEDQPGRAAGEGRASC